MNRITINDLIHLIEDDDKIVQYVNEAYSGLPLYLDSSLSAGELANYLAELTSSYAFILEVISQCDHINNYIEEHINEYSAAFRHKNQTVYKVKKTIQDKEDESRFITIKELNLFNKSFKGKKVQDLIWMGKRIQSIRNYFKYMADIVDRSIESGRTILSYQKEELKNLGVS